MNEEHDKINNAIKAVLSKGYRTLISNTGDQAISTEKMGDLI